MKCKSCGHQNDQSNAFCLNCGASLVAAPVSAPPAAPEVTAVSRMERGIYFSIARVVAWVLALVALVAMVYSAMGLVPALLQARGSADSVTTADLTTAIEASRAGGQRSWQMESEEDEYSAKDLAALDQVIYELVELVPAQLTEQQGGVDSMRSYVKRQLGRLDLEDLDDEIAVVRDAKKAVGEVVAPDRLAAIGIFFDMTRQRNNAAQAKALVGKAKLTAWVTGFGSSAVSLMLVTMILVLMSIERNTRR